MSDLTGIDEEEKDADPVIDPLDLFQDLMRNQTPLFIETLDRPQTSPLRENSSVLDVLSNTNVLSVNGPLHQAFESDELNSLSTEKEEEKSITQLKTVQDIDTTGIWGFDVESSENSMDNYEGPLSWDPQREFMQFLWDDHDDSPMEEPPMADPPPNSQRRRKRKMDMVVMVDPSEELFSDLSLKSTKDVFDEEDLEDPVPINKVQSLRKRCKPQSLTRKKAPYPNGTVEAIKQLIFNAPARNPHEKSVAHRLKTLKGNPLTDSCSEEEPLFFPCTKCNINFKEKNHLHRHMRTHTDPPSLINIPKPFICRECGQSFRFRNSLLRHMTIHQERRERLMEEIKGMNELKDEGTDARLQCPQCTFGTNCPNTFVQHAKTHEKDKRYYDCKNCNYMAVTVLELERHMNKEHSLCKNLDKPDKPRVFRSKEDDKTPHSYSCNHCSYGTSSKNIFKNHLEIRHNQTYEEYDVFQSRERNEDAQSPSEKHFPIRKPTVVNSFSSELTSKLSVKKMAFRKRTDLPCDSNDISDLFKKDKVVHRAQRGFKSQTTESKLDKSINNLLSRQRRDKQRDEKNVTTGCFFVEGTNGDRDHDFGQTLSGISESPNSSSNGHKHLLASKLENNILNSGCDSSLSEGNSVDLNSKHVSKLVVEMPVMKKSPSKRKMSTPYRNTVDQDSYLILPKHFQSQKMQNMVEEMEDSDNKDVFQYSDDTTNANNKVPAKSEIKQEKLYIGNSFSRRMSMKGVLGTSADLFEKGQNRNSQQKPVVKEECIETQVFGENLAPNSVPLSESFLDADSEGGGERKTCPYCPAEFESGVGLSNHVRGHLHRVGLNYNARHVVSREQVASQDRKPRIRRKMGAIRLKKEPKFGSEGAPVRGHSCPLCGDSFDNKTGLSNHVRGHLKRLGKTIATKSKSPMLLLRELMRDKREFQRALQILGKKRIPSHSRIASKQVTSNHLTPPKRNPIQNLYNNAKPLVPMYSLSGETLDKKQAETKLEVKGSLSSALIGILKKRKCQEDSKLRTSSQTARSALAVSSASEYSRGAQVNSTLSNSTSEKGEFNRKVCVHCNATFHSGVSLSNHLRAYAKRKSTALLEGTTYDCKQRRQRSRPGSKKKMSPTMPHAPEEMYRLTCRFCDLVFQGPLSVQEDWIKHLQRHIMNASVPHTGAGMREVTSLPRDPSYPTSDRQTPSLATHTAS
ncbi:zinc finger protein 644 [Salvelinus sp. IW2-2015]|uniref:zinc finger protein 644 n=1 Tax=Salvelinus sp. IW2-2015 TaxID=2691554 RepID=UPI000CDF5C5C|nr:zinc finger protein 644 [Salvelinus alpinus]